MKWHPASLVATAIGLILLAGVLPSGCASPKNADSKPGMEYSRGSLRAVEAASMDQVWRASRAALNALDITELDAQQSALGAYLDGRTPELKKVSVKMMALSDDLTELKIRISTFGDEDLARLIYDKIQKALAP